MDKTIKYFCTTCEKDIKSNDIHIDFGFVKKHTIRPKLVIKNKHLCMCKDCFNNYAVLDINNYPQRIIKEHMEYYR